MQVLKPEKFITANHSRQLKFKNNQWYKYVWNKKEKKSRKLRANTALCLESFRKTGYWVKK